MEMGRNPVKTTVVNWRRWALYGSLVAAVYTGVETYSDLETKSVALYASKMLGSVIAGAVLGSVAALVRNRHANRDGAGEAKSDSAA